MTDLEYSSDPLIRTAQEEARDNNQSYYILFAGPPGGGKSYACMKYLQLADPDFNIDQIAFTAKDFGQILKKTKPGHALMWDEMGVEFDSREFQEKLNKMLTHVTMTMRYKRIIFGVTVPIKEWTDKKWRALIHSYCEMWKKFVNERAFGVFHILQTNYRFGKTYHKCPIVTRDKKPYIVSRVEWPKPTQDLIDAYEARKHPYGDKVLDDMLDEIDAQEIKRSNAIRLKDTDIINYVSTNKDEFKRNNILDIDKIALKFELGRDRRNDIRRKLHAVGLINKRGGKRNKNSNLNYQTNSEIKPNAITTEN